ncbi:hypothetical protein CC86DRAFT_382128 [Ophiobolus disseminans]|uniref:Uncharacterized protein n=1 Tax=Ophiobolus disseminans TaxID=1469910 RepID=A0A6A7A309_9PLEO|nr:hypothetical protein CC86DRAFT_382128 [Ophiobolus disseminans]
MSSSARDKEEKSLNDLGELDEFDKIGHPSQDDLLSIARGLSLADATNDSAKTFVKFMASLSGFISAVQYALATQPRTWSALLTGTLGSTPLQQRKGNLGHCVVLMFMMSFIPRVAAQGAAADPSMDWRQRAMEALTDAVASCAFLVPPFIILSVCVLLTSWCLHTQSEGALAGLMLLMIPIYRSIGVNLKEGASINESMRTAVGVGYMLFMFGYCRQIIIRNEKDKGTTFISVLLGLLIGISLLAVTFIRDFVKDTMELAPACIVPLALPLGFTLRDLYLHVTKADKESDRAHEEENLRRFLVKHLETQRREESHYFSLEGLRRRTGLFNRSGYDLDAEEYSLDGYGDGDAPQATIPPPSVPASGNWFTRLFSKPKVS